MLLQHAIPTHSGMMRALTRNSAHQLSAWSAVCFHELCTFVHRMPCQHHKLQGYINSSTHWLSARSALTSLLQLHNRLCLLMPPQMVAQLVFGQQLLPRKPQRCSLGVKLIRRMLQAATQLSQWLSLSLHCSQHATGAWHASGICTERCVHLHITCRS